MWIIVMLAACLVPALVFLLARSGAGLRARQAEPLPDIPRERWPRTGLVIPAAGSPDFAEGGAREISLYIAPMTDTEKEIVKAGCLINFNRNR